jgi:4-amino-4-deoxy-L-arabinose transferase-like glycosyltransferase
MLEKAKLRVARHPYWALAILTFAAFFPFLTKPFNMDDPLFLWAARQIQLHPGNPYAFNVNWYAFGQPMWQVTENPPFTSYFIAIVAGICGWGETGLHLAFVLPAVAAVLGTYRLAKSFCAQPGLAALITLFTPVFLVSGTTLMCDMTLLAFWVWTVVFWVEGMERNNWRYLLLAGLLASLAFLTKYYGLCLVPLLAAHGLLQKRNWGWWLSWLLIPLATLLAYQLATSALYGQGLLSGAAKYTSGWPGMAEALTLVMTLTFTGGCLAPAVFFAPLMWRLRTLALFAGGTALAVVLLLTHGLLANNFPNLTAPSQMPVEIQMIFWSVGGICVLALAGGEIFCRRDAKSWLLALWVFGTFAFTAFLNWTVNGRSLLPLAPALAILIARRLEQKSPAWPPVAKILVLPCAVLALLVARSDFLLATAVRQSAEEALAKYGSAAGTVWFEGHWGFQYYAQLAGGKAMDADQLELFQSKDVLLVPVGNSNLLPLDSGIIASQDSFTIPGPAYLATWNPDIGAGFYATTGGPLPFAFGKAAPEKTGVLGLYAPPGFVFFLKPNRGSLPEISTSKK